MPSGGPLLIVEVGLSVSVQRNSNFRVAALCVPEESVYPDWTDVTYALATKSVRVIEGDLRDAMFDCMKSLRKRVSTKACASELVTEPQRGHVLLAPPAMLSRANLGQYIECQR